MTAKEMHFALYGRNFGQDAEKRMRVLLEHLSRRGVRVSCCTALAGSLRLCGIRIPAPATEFSGAGDLPHDVDIILSLGGTAHSSARLRSRETAEYRWQESISGGSVS